MGMLDGKVAFITGGARGQGRAHAEASAREGADIVIVDVDRPIGSVPYSLATSEDLEETARLVEKQGQRCVALTADVRSQEQLDAAVARGIEELGKIDILIANAGIWTRGPFWELTDTEWDDMINVNLTGVWKSAKAVTPHMISRGSGSLVLISSTNGLEAGPNYAHYVAAKHGVIGLMKNIALELAPYGIRCNAISPGAIKTPMVDHPLAYQVFAGCESGTEEDLLAAGYHFAAMKGTTFMPPEVIARTALYLNSDLAEFVTGTTIPVDAGHLLLPGVNPAPVVQ